MVSIPVSNNVRVNIIDLLVVLAIAVGTESLVGYVTLDIFSLPIRLSGLLFITFCYIIRFGFSFPKVGGLLSKPLLRLYFIVLTWEIIQMAVSSKMEFLGFTVRLFTYLMTCIYFYRATRNFTDITNLIKPYSAYYIYSFVIIILASIFMTMGVISPTDNELAESELLRTNMSAGTIYYWPGCLSVVSSDSRVVLWSDLPVFFGLSHEPHVFGHCTFPAFFLLLYLLKDKKFFSLLAYISLFILLLLCFASTSLVSLVVTFLLGLASMRGKKVNFGYTISLVLVAIALLYFFVSKFDILHQIDFLFTNKIESGSQDYSANLINYTLSPKGIVGTGIYPPLESRGTVGGNIGIISSLLIILFELFFYYKTIKAVFSKQELCKYIGLSCLYFSIHSLKLGPLIFNYPMLLYMVVLLTFADSLNRKSKAYLTVKV